MLSSMTITFLPFMVSWIGIIRFTTSSLPLCRGSMKLRMLPFLRYLSFIKPSSMGTPLSRA